MPRCHVVYHEILYMYLLLKGGKFLKPETEVLRRWGVLQDDFVLSAGLIM